MKLAIIITTYNRFDLLKDCVRTLVASNIPAGTEFIIVDDASAENPKAVLQPLIEKFYCDPWLLDRQNGVASNLKLGFDVAVNRHADLLCNLDPDTVVKPNWLDRLFDLHKRFPDKIVTGFNTLSGGRHKIFFEGADYILKKTIGGINMLFDVDMYKQQVRTILQGDSWDWDLCYNMQRIHKMFVVTKPSVIQHTGTQDGLHVGPGIIPDTAEDF